MHLHPYPALHPVFETLAYAVGYAVYRSRRARARDHLTDDRRWIVIATATVGALLGSRLLGILQYQPTLHLGLPGFLHAVIVPGGGKTIVGGLLGGWIAVELVKRLLSIRSRTGDLFAVPLALGIAIGRIGCLLAGIADDTYGLPTRSAFFTHYLSIDLGDGIPRHPVQIYEIAFLLALALVLHQLSRRPHPQGLLFRLFLFSYLAWRLLIDTLKPQPLFHGLSPIQWSCALALALLLPDLAAYLRNSPAPLADPRHPSTGTT